MIHPHTKLVFLNEQMGYGVFATRFIPKGTITYVKDSLEISISDIDFQRHSPELQEVIEKYSYRDQHGDKIISWDFGKYVNHCCNCNTISTGYGFEIAIRDIYPDEEITDEYGIFNLTEEMELSCGETCCRKKITPEDFSMHYQSWDEKIKQSIFHLFDVNQPLLSFIDDATKNDLETLQQDPNQYKSVSALMYQNTKVAA
ncbi:SET domain-containing protein [Arcticibacterium luteifluviistationis]|uniref:SET domain-containing protein-lysine N-methyltransferase n=1 Tax=Arcticibacterium luteifluviistationis TaxID=1784714 RepID=A0A2Z4GA77_9BACT|nr:SET domain-containing protein [Arcticibacterium luteifluviistationis]AWV97990.1 SET domain-containing protein-lysine N-methyltransferase [Arcticibacterium luteifluviistationis]